MPRVQVSGLEHPERFVERLLPDLGRRRRALRSNPGRDVEAARSVRTGDEAVHVVALEVDEIRPPPLTTN